MKKAEEYTRGFSIILENSRKLKNPPNFFELLPKFRKFSKKNDYKKRQLFWNSAVCNSRPGRDGAELEGVVAVPDRGGFLTNGHSRRTLDDRAGNLLSKSHLFVQPNINLELQFGIPKKVTECETKRQHFSMLFFGKFSFFSKFHSIF